MAVDLDGLGALEYRHAAFKEHAPKTSREDRRLDRCRAGHEDKGQWIEMAICYFDHYVKSEGHWCFERRDEKHWYSTDWLERPRGPEFQNWPGKNSPRHAAKLPQAWPSWERYWGAIGDDARRQVTSAP